MEKKGNQRAVNNYLRIKRLSMPQIHLDMKEETMLLHKQQSTGGQLLYSVIGSLKRA